MKVAVDGRVLYGKYQGTRTYLTNMLSEIDKIDTDIDFYLFHDNKVIIDYSNIKSLGTTIDNRIINLLYGIGSKIKSEKIDVFYSQYISPVYCPSKKVVAIHDVLPVTHKQYFTTGFSLTRKYAFGLSAIRADQIHTVSEYTKNSLINVYGIEEDKIHVVPNGVELNIKKIGGKSECREFLRNYVGDADIYLLTVGRVEPRKNYHRLLDVLSTLKHKYKDIKFKLAIIGHVERGANELFELININNLNENVALLRDVDDHTLYKIYNAVDAFVYPSLAEGFGIPPLEAMSVGTPVISSNATAMPEILSDAAQYFNPLDEEDMQHSIEAVIFKEQLKSNLINKGYDRIKKYSWENTAKKYLSAIELIA